MSLVNGKRKKDFLLTIDQSAAIRRSTMKRLPEIECPRCNGEGHIELPRILSETLAIVASVVTRANAATIESINAKLPKVKAPALRERLKTLCRLSLLDSEKIGPVTFYSVKPSTITSKK